MGRTPECSVFGASHQTATGIPMGNWTDISPRIAIVGAGRLGTALAAALRDAGIPVDGPHGRGFDGSSADAVLLCVPDAQIAAAAACVTPGVLVGHCSGATGLGVLDGHEGFGLHPLMTVPASGADFTGAGCAIAGSSDRARSLARHLAECLGMTPFTVADEDRAAYHAAAAIASNLLVALEADAERLAASAGVPREALVPLVRASVENWVRDGGRRALTGPIARGDEETVAIQRAAVSARAPELLPLFDVLGDRARALAGRDAPSARVIARSTADLRDALAPARRAGRTIGFVPTMGALHDGHRALIERARAEHDVVVVSVFVNPTQFEDPADLAAYPRLADADAQVAFGAGADVVFTPAVAEVYPDGFATTVTVRGPLTETLEGAHRGVGHFDGVTTVVAKLLAMVSPDAAYFGRKDAQQAAVVTQMTRDLNLPMRIVVCPTVRDADGLALSSRNARLAPDERERALALSRALGDVAEAIADGRITTAAAASAAGLDALRAGGADPEYFEAVDPLSLAPAGELRGDVLLLTAARVGDVRLIDNLAAHAPAAISPTTPSVPETRAATVTAASTLMS